MDYALTDIPEQWIDGSRPQAAKPKANTANNSSSAPSDASPTTEPQNNSETSLPSTPPAEDLF